MVSDLTAIMTRHCTWVRAQGYRNKLPLEQLMLIVTEVAEAAQECRNDQITDNFALELADIVLRTIYLADECNIDLKRALLDKIALNEATGHKGRTV